MKKFTLLFMALVLILALSACSVGADASAAAASVTTTAGTEQSSNVTQVQTTNGSSASTTTADPQTETSQTHEAAEDYIVDAAAVIPISFNGNSATADGTGVTVDGGQVTITAAGTYSLSGSLSDGQILVDTKDEGTVQLILNGVELTSATSAPIYIKDAKKVIIILAEGTKNTVSDGKSYVYAAADVDEPGAAIYSKSNLTIYGSGSLTVNGNYLDGIASQDGLIIASGTITVHAADDGIRGKDYLVVKAGSLTVTSQADALKSGNAVTVNGGTIHLSAGDDGIHADTALIINGGDIRVAQSYEGLESAVITLNGGNVQVTASDDGVNVAGGKDSSGKTQAGQPGQTPDTFNTAASCYLYINGGYLLVDANGDGIDVNGAIEMTDGVVVVNGPTEQMNGALDYDAGFKMSGGLIVAAGSSGMAMAPDQNSSQSSVLIYLTAAQPAGTLVHIQNSAREDILTFAPQKDYQSIVFSSPELVQGETYTIYTGGSATGTITDGLYQAATYTAGTQYTSFTPSSAVTSVGTGGGMRGPGGQRP